MRTQRLSHWLERTGCGDGVALIGIIKENNHNGKDQGSFEGGMEVHFVPVLAAED